MDKKSIYLNNNENYKRAKLSITSVIINKIIMREKLSKAINFSEEIIVLTKTFTEIYLNLEFEESRKGILYSNMFMLS